ncbi:MAG: MMPL family transporter [Planctomycetota bacterium]|nr:MMPL family transporter [Planctomycetota bacterium]
MHERIRDALLSRWGWLVASRPWPTLLVCVLLAAASIVLTVQHLSFVSDRSELIDQDLSWNRRYAEYKDQFPRWDDVIVCIEGAADDQRIDELARRIARQLMNDERIGSADAGFNVSETGPRLFAAAPPELFEEMMDRIARARRLAAASHANAALATALAEFSDAPEGESTLAEMDEFLQPYLDALRGRPPDFAFLRPDQSRWLPLVSEFGSGRLRFIQVHFAGADEGIASTADDIAWLRAEIAPLIDASALPELEWGVTGIPAIEADETAQSIHDSTIASLLAFALITALMLAVFRGIIVPLLAASALLIGMAWSFGWLTLAVGHLQLLSVVFSVILLGLGVDFAVHLVARLELVQDEHQHLHSAISRVFRGIGPGMLTGAVTTAAAFGATALTQFKGMAEMGLIASGGIILCLIATLSCFPASLAATGKWKRVIRHRPGGETAHFAHGRLDIVDRRARGTLIVAGVLVILLAAPMYRVQYDPNVLNLQPPGVESVEWEKRIVEDNARSVWAALVQTTPENAADLADDLRALPGVHDVGAMGLLLPPDREERGQRIAALRAQPVQPIEARTGEEALLAQLQLVRVGVSNRARTAPGSVAARLRDVQADIQTAFQAYRDASADEQAVRLARLEEAFGYAREALSDWLEQALAPIPPAPADLPALLREQWTDGDTWLLRIYPAADPQGRSILHPDRLGEFVNTLLAVEPTTFGPPVQIWESTQLIIREYIKAACYAVAAILILLLLDFRSLADALCAMTPVLIGFIGVFGLMGITGAPLNFANIIVMPLIFGIGVDAGVHIVHRWRAEPFGRPAGLSGGTGRGITLTMITTMVGFGCMLVAEHRGIRSLGFVMLAGLSVTLLACYTVLPALLRLRTAPEE